jgi:hypothetical protein
VAGSLEGAGVGALVGLLVGRVAGLLLGFLVLRDGVVRDGALDVSVIGVSVGDSVGADDVIINCGDDGTDVGAAVGADAVGEGVLTSIAANDGATDD